MIEMYRTARISPEKQMSKDPEPIDTSDCGEALRMYRAPWKGEVLFVCKKCQRKMSRDAMPALAKVKKWFKKRAKKSKDAPMHVIQIPCVDLCPKDGVTIFSRRQLMQEPSGVCIARTEADLEKLYCELTEVALSSENATLK
jgi:hypothetical protein